MAAYNVDRRGVDSISQGFETFGNHAQFYSVWQGKNMKFQSKIEDSGLFHENIEALKQAGSDALFTVRFHGKPDKDGFVTDKTPYISSFNFKVIDETKQLGTIGAANGAYGDPNVNSKLDLILKNQNEQESRIAALEEEPDEDEEEKPKGFLGVIETIAATEQGQAIITNMIGTLLNKFMPATNTPILKPTSGIAGIPEDDEESAIVHEYAKEQNRLWKAIERLQSKDGHFVEDLEKLADMAEKNTITFNMLLGMLRKQ